MKRGLWLLVCLGAACARQGAIPGGPPDRVAPIVIETSPGPMEVLDEWREPVVITFNERISERATGGSLDDVVLVSPHIEDIEVKHRRDGLEISAPDGFPAGKVYRFTIQTMISDLFGNTLREPFELVFSTGPEPVPTVVAGSVTDRISGQAQSIRVDAVLSTGATETEDAEVYPSRSDQDGIFTLRFLPPGRYRLRAFEDRNRNGEPDFGEPQAQTTALLNAAGDTAIYELETLAGDSTAARVTEVAVTDSVTVQVTLDDYLDPDRPLNDIQVTFGPADDSLAVGPVPVTEQVLHAFQHEALLRDRAAAAAADTSTGVPAGRVPVSPLANRAANSGPPPPPRPQQTFFVITGAPLPPGVELEVRVARVTNINGVPGGGGEQTLMREVAADTAAVPDSLAAPDSGQVVDTSSVLDAAGPADVLPLVADSGRVMPSDSTAGVGADSVPAPPDTLAPPDTTFALRRQP